MPDVLYALEIVGGPYDGVPGLKWKAGRDFPVPKVLLLGRCKGDGACGARKCAGRPHPYYWMPEEDGIPIRTVRYELADEVVFSNGTDLSGVATYAIGGLTMPRGRSIEVEQPAPLVTASSLVNMFAGLDPETLDRLKFAAECVRAQAQEWIIDEGER